MDTTQLLAERGKTHGDYSDHAAATQNLKFIIHYHANAKASGASTYNSLRPYAREALDMIAHKIGRILAGDPDFRDHWDDIAGYAKLVADRCTK